VHALASGLEDLLRMQLGRTDWGRLWIDSRVDSAQRITPEVEAALRGSALLLVVLSEGWLASPWCAHELELFLARHGHDGARGRIFVLHGAAVEPDRRPEPIRDLRGFDLYVQHRDGRERRLGFPLPQPDRIEDRPYFERLDDVSRAVARRLRELRAAAGAAPPMAPVPSTIAAPATPADAGASAIYIAEATPDLRAHRDLLTRQLDQSGYAVRPAALLPAAPADYRQAAERELAASLLFVQLLGPYTLDKRPGLPQGYEALQLELAEAAGLPILRWMDPDVDQDKLDDPALFRRREVVVGGFDDFKRQVEQTAARLLLPAPTPPDTDRQVLIRVAADDEDIAYDIGDRLLADGIGYEVVDDAAPLAELMRRAPYQGLVVVYDRCDRDWAREQVNECRVIAMSPEGRNTACAVLDRARAGKRRLGIRVPRFHWLSAPDDPNLGQFVQALAGAGA
jgi:hypothetical protein